MSERPGFVPFDIPVGLPLEMEDAIDFNKAIQAYNPPRGWLQRIISASQFIDRPTFERGMDRLFELASQKIQGHYAVMLSSRDKSDYWIYDQLLQRGLPQAGLKYDKDSDETAEEYRKRGGTKSLTQLWIESVPEDVPICAFDDFSITGAQVKEVFSAYGRRNVQAFDSRFNAFLLYATDDALQNMIKANVKSHVAAGSIRTLGQTLQKIDLTFLERLDDKVRHGKGGLIPPPVLFWTWYKMPDNIPPVFTGDGLPPLIRAERYKEPYKSI